ncbi:hypothetical protein KQ874_01280 [Mycoplasma sp. ES3157-GEN-MYC]|uniref:Uncharacterized protein n=1 Tax=Mycoplasma miroungigenitalium TaxID=754515 RepID=A0A6M4JBM5_9MOLU|nr:hypothetical protein [Mycoplasma miroungigenitalium]MBU4690321.1 hypothetical protein [Mycoplasma miroungigenitalium]MBU4691588.1 hypothetical protein [Mycoplasma miroungigenitalium]QJR43416.1 hypothetical protein HLA87_01270 [Mycoplasma miroungigenitalium]
MNKKLLLTLGFVASLPMVTVAASCSKLSKDGQELQQYVENVEKTLLLKMKNQTFSSDKLISKLTPKLEKVILDAKNLINDTQKHEDSEYKTHLHNLVDVVKASQERITLLDTRNNLKSIMKTLETNIEEHQKAPKYSDERYKKIKSLYDDLKANIDKDDIVLLQSLYKKAQEL